METIGFIVFFVLLFGFIWSVPCDNKPSEHRARFLSNLYTPEKKKIDK